MHVTRPYADYSYYTGLYLGNIVPEDYWPGLSMRTAEYLNQITFGRAMSAREYHKDLADATCAIAESLYRGIKSAERDTLQPSERGIKAETTGKYRVEYDTGVSASSGDYAGAASAAERIRDIASRYLAHTGLMYAGVYV